MESRFATLGTEYTITRKLSRWREVTCEPAPPGAMLTGPRRSAMRASFAMTHWRTLSRGEPHCSGATRVCLMSRSSIFDSWYPYWQTGVCDGQECSADSGLTGEHFVLIGIVS